MSFKSSFFFFFLHLNFCRVRIHSKWSKLSFESTWKSLLSQVWTQVSKIFFLFFSEVPEARTPHHKMDFDGHPCQQRQFLRFCGLDQRWINSFKVRNYVKMPVFQYRGSPPYAHFWTWKKTCYMKFVLVGLYYRPLLAQKSPTCT